MVRGLVQEKEIRFRRKRSGEADTTGLTAGKPDRVLATRKSKFV
jgi:hypothetical protein